MTHWNKWMKWGLRILVGIVVLLFGLFLILRTEVQDLDETALNSAPGNILHLPGGLVHYQLDGPERAPLVVLVHGFSVPQYVWDPTAAALVKEGYQVLRYDLYGRGFSARVDAAYDMDLFVSQLEDMLAALDLPTPMTLVGLSMGAPITARYAHLHPEQVSGVVLIAPEVFQTHAGDIFPLNVPFVGEYLMSAVMEPLVLPAIQSADFYRPEKFPDWEDRYRGQLKYRGTGRALLSTIRNLTTLNPIQEYQELEKTGLPVLLIWGKEDRTIGFDQVSQLQQILPDLELVVIERAGHLPHLEDSFQVNSVLDQFIQDHVNP